MLRQLHLFLTAGFVKTRLAFRERRLKLSPIWWLTMLELHWRESMQRPVPAAGPQAFDQQAFDDSYRRWLGRRARPAWAGRRGGPGSDALSLDVVALVTKASDLDRLLRSTEGQLNDPWDLWLVCVDDEGHRRASTLQTQSTSAVRVHIFDIRAERQADGCWIPPGRQPYVVLIDPASVLAPDALRQVGRAVASLSESDWIYTDDDQVDGDGYRRDPYLKGAFDPQLVAVDDYAARLAVARRATIRDVGGLRRAFGEAQIYDLLLRIATQGGRIEHLAEVCCHRLGPVPAVLSAEHRRAAERVLFDAKAPAVIDVVESVPAGLQPLPRVRWRRDAPSVTIVIPTRDRLDLLEPCIDSLRRTVNPRSTRLVIADDGSRDPAAREYLDRLEHEAYLHCRVLATGQSEERFNYARIMNRASAEVETPLMLHLNNDIEAIAPGWLEQMAGWLSWPDVGAVGAKLLYPDRSVQHSGIVVWPGGGAIEHFQKYLVADDRGYQWLPHRVREVSAVTGACLLTRTDFFRDLGGFDETNFAVQFNDVDWCLRARAGGKRIVYEPGAVLFHRTSATRGRAYDYRETLSFLKKYGDYRECFLSGHLQPLSLCGPTPLLRR